MRKGLQISLCLLWTAVACVDVFPQQTKLPTKSTANHSLSGIVTAESGGPLEGVLVSAKRVGSPITVTVVSDAEGRYSFSRGRLAPGPYNLTIRAVGYVLPARRVVITGQSAATANLQLAKASDLAPQLTSGEWLMSVPGDESHREGLYNCLSCHSLNPVLQSNYDAHGNVKVMHEMRNESPASNINFSSKLPYYVGPRSNDSSFAEYLSTINLSDDRTHWGFSLKTLPRPTGKSTRVIVTEYDLPRPDTMPSFAVMDSKGMVWYADFLQPIVGRLDPKTGKVKEWPLPLVKPGFEPGSLCLRVDNKDKIWIARSFQGAAASSASLSRTSPTRSSPISFKASSHWQSRMVMRFLSALPIAIPKYSLPARGECWSAKSMALP